MTSAVLLYHCELEILELQTVADVSAEGEKGDGHFRDNAGIVVLNKGVIASNIYDGAEHIFLQLADEAGSGPGIIFGQTVSILSKGYGLHQEGHILGQVADGGNTL